VKRVVIPYFQIEVQSKGGKDASSKGFMSKMKNNVSVTYTIDGVDQAAMQALADSLYANLVTSFKARGIEVIDRKDALPRSKNYAKIEAAYQQTPIEKGMAGGGKSMFYAPTGMGVYFVG
jgi:TolB-like protein